MADRQNSSGQFGTAVTTGQGQGGWQMRSSVKDGFSRRPVALQKLPLIPSKRFQSGSDLDCSHSTLPGEAKFKKQCAVQNTVRNGSDSMESMQDHVGTTEPGISDPDMLSSTDTEDSGDEDDPRGALITDRSLRPGGMRLTLGQAPKEKKKVGRPIAYRGDPNSPELTEVEKRRIKRRIANRESARRVRHKRQELLDDLQVKIDLLQSQNTDLRANTVESKQEKEELSQELRELHVRHKQLMSTNASMQTELDSLRSSLQLRMTELEHALDRQEILAGSDGLEEKTLFGSAQVQSDCAPGYRPQAPFASQDQRDFKGSYSFQMALNSLPSFQLSEQFMPPEAQDLSLLENCNTIGARPSAL